MFQLSLATLEEFFDVYKGVLPEYIPMIEHMSSGPLIAMEIRQQNAVAKFRELCGPHDPEISKYLKPDTIRAKFGIERVRNVVHCTDMPEDGVIEVISALFNIYSSSTSSTFCRTTSEEEA